MPSVDSPPTIGLRSGKKHRSGLQRAKFACQSCRTKKVRCDSTRGMPCANCRLYEEECVVSPRRTKWRNSLVRNCRSRIRSAPSETDKNDKKRPEYSPLSTEIMASSLASNNKDRHKESPKQGSRDFKSMDPMPKTLPSLFETAGSEQLGQFSSLDAVIDFRVHDWDIILGALDENAIAAMMGFEDHLRHPPNGLDSDHRAVPCSAASVPEGSGTRGATGPWHADLFCWDYRASAPDIERDSVVRSLALSNSSDVDPGVCREADLAAIERTCWK